MGLGAIVYEEVNNTCETIRQQYENSTQLKARLEGSECYTHSRSVQKISPWGLQHLGRGGGGSSYSLSGSSECLSIQRLGYTQRMPHGSIDNGESKTEERNKSWVVIHVIRGTTGCYQQYLQHELNLQESKGGCVWLGIRFLLAEPQLIQSSPAQFQSVSAFPQGFHNFPSY